MFVGCLFNYYLEITVQKVNVSRVWRSCFTDNIVRETFLRHAHCVRKNRDLLVQVLPPSSYIMVSPNVGGSIQHKDFWVVKQGDSTWPKLLTFSKTTTNDRNLLHITLRTLIFTGCPMFSALYLI